MSNFSRSQVSTLIVPRGFLASGVGMGVELIGMVFDVVLKSESSPVKSESGWDAETSAESNGLVASCVVSCSGGSGGRSGGMTLKLAEPLTGLMVALSLSVSGDDEEDAGGAAWSAGGCSVVGVGGNGTCDGEVVVTGLGQGSVGVEGCGSSGGGETTSSGVGAVAAGEGNVGSGETLVESAIFVER